MKNIVIIFLVCLVLFMVFSEAKSTTVGPDGYAFHEKEYDNKQVLISIVTFKNWNEFRTEAKRLGMNLEDGDNVTVAFTLVDTENPQICTIYMIDPEVLYLPEYAGHEFLHCAYGQWHISNDSKGY